MDETLTIDEASSPGNARLFRVRGTLDGRGAAEVEARCHEALEAGRHVVLNLEGVTFLASTGIGAMLALTEEFRERGLELRLAAPSQEVVTPIELLCLQNFLRVFPSEEQALLDWAA